MKSNFKFDKASGTYVPTNKDVTKTTPANVRDNVKVSASTSSVTKPKFIQEKKIDTGGTSPNVLETYAIQMKKTDRLTPVQLLDDNGMLVSYLDSVNTGVLIFRERQDYDICQITDERSGKVLAYIGGYALQFSFNMAELNTIEKIEGCLQGLVKLFRHKIMNQNLTDNQR